jgi:site-specific recombinase XerD
MAWTEELPSGKYRGRYRDAAGKRQSVGTFTRKAQALREAAKKELSQQSPGAVSPTGGKLTWGRWVEEWWPKRAVEANTAKQDYSRLNNHLLPRWRNVRLDRIERDDVQAWVAELASGALSPSSVQKVYSLMSASMKAAVLARKLHSSPCVSIDLPTIPPADEHYLTRKEYAAVRAAMPTQRWRALCDLLVGTGMRWGEAVALHRHRVFRLHSRIDVMEAYDGASQQIKAYPKGKKKRGVPITDELRDTLGEWMDSNPGECRTPHAKGSTCRAGGLVFSEDGEVLDYWHFFHYVWRPAVEIAGVEGTKIHDLRHTYASWLIQDGTSLDQIQLLLGHASSQTTQRYTHLVDTQWDKIRASLSGKSVPNLSHATPDVDHSKITKVDFRRRSAQ